MITVGNIEKLLSEKIPYDLSWEWDNIGLLVGNPDTQVDNIMFTVDVTGSVIDEAVKNNCSLIVSHHPVIFSGLKRIRKDDYESSKIYSLVENGISAICMHTNLDNVKGGMNDSICSVCGISVDSIIDIEGKPSCRIGEIKTPLDTEDFALYVKERISAGGVTFFDCGKKVKKIAVVTGGGSSCIVDAYKNGCDTVLTGELKHNNFIDAKEMGINLICAGHYYTEKSGLDLVRKIIKSEYPTISFFESESLEELYKFV